MLFRILASIILSCLFHAGRGQAVNSLSLSACIEIAVKNNPNLRKSEISLSRNEILYKQSQYNRLPSVSGGLSHYYNQGRSVNSTTNQFVESSYFSGNQSLSLSVPVFNGLRILHDTRMKASAREAGKFEFETAVNELKLDVIEAYVLVLTAQDMLKQAEGQLAVTVETLHRSEILNREGDINPGDYYDLKGQASSEQNTLMGTKQTLNDCKARLASLLNMSLDVLPDLVPLALPLGEGIVSRELLYKQALSVLPQFRALEARINEAKQGIQVAKSSYYPSLSFSAGIESRFSSVDPAGYNYWKQFKSYPSKWAGLTLSVPIFSQMSIRTNVKLAKLDLNEAEWNQKIQENNLREETAKAVFSLITLQKNVSNLLDQEGSYTEAFRIAQVHFEAGNSNSVLFLTAKNKLDNTKNQLLIKQYEWLLQKYINDYYAGSLDL
ncbi:TolC family protein [Sphingobacterium sp. LRF_L2]|uniref:TolC family protein n=1 Tax=Sphingobacterium sp. LRF_L2 TaxID=3369421 RepID=UPI003F6291FB